MPGGSPYYVDNTNGQSVVFDGFTTVLTAWAAVNPCDTYHLRIAVADGAKHTGACDTLTDATEDQVPYCMGMYDSGIFLKQHSLRSTDSLWVEARGGVGGDSVSAYAVRGCLGGGFRLYRGLALPYPLSLTYTVSGSAIPAQDYSPLSGTVILPAGAAYVDIPVEALSQGSGVRSLTLRLTSPYTAPCASMLPQVLDSATLFIYDQVHADIVPTDTTICTGCSVQLMVDGDPALEYAWSPAAGLNNAAVQNPLATPAQTTQYFMTATAPALLCPEAVDSVYVYVGGVGIQELSPGGKISIAPNPFRQQFQLVSDQAEAEEYTLLLRDILGRQRWSLKGRVADINKRLPAIAARMAPGVYLIRISAEQGQAQSIQLVKE
jgi:hypothetical protein